MHDKTYIWLGSKRAKRKGANPAAIRLDMARNARLPVPAGIVLLDEAWHYAREHEFVITNGTHITFREPDFARELIQSASFDNPVELIPTRLQPKLDMRPYQKLVTEPDQFAPAVAASWSYLLGFERSPDSRLDIIVREQVEAESMGTALSQTSYQHDLIFPVDEDQSSALTRLENNNGGEQSPANSRLQQLLRGVRTTFGDENWLIEWADDGEVCWLLGIWEADATWQRQDQFISWPLLSSMAASDAFITEANGLWRDELNLTGDRPVVRLAHGQAELNLTYLNDFFSTFGGQLDLEGSNGQLEFQVPVVDKRLWRNPRLAGRIVTLQRRFASWLEQEMEKPHTPESLRELAVRSEVRRLLASCRGRYTTPSAWTTLQARLSAA